MTTEQATYEKGWGRCDWCFCRRPLAQMDKTPFIESSSGQEAGEEWRCRDLEWCHRAAVEVRPWE